MTDHGPCAARPEEIAEARRKCWAPTCNRTARLEWCGWRYCIPHFWTYVLRDAPGWRHKLGKLRWTELARSRGTK